MLKKSQKVFGRSATVGEYLPRSVVVVRHAESIANTQGIYQGQTYDTDLSSLGYEQAKALARRLNGFGIKRIVTSPLKRTMMTSRIVADALKVDVDIDERIIETNHGEWEGKSKEWILENYESLYRLWLSEPIKVTFPRGESFADTIRRVSDFLKSENFRPNILVVTHDNIIRIIMSLINNTSINDMWKIPLESASINVFEVDGGRDDVIKLSITNDTRHLVGLNSNVSNHAL
jgi:probable phosphoglycerate mutase